MLPVHAGARERREIFYNKTVYRINNEKGAIKLYFTFENCIIKYLFVFYRTRNSSNSLFSSNREYEAAAKAEAE